MKKFLSGSFGSFVFSRGALVILAVFLAFSVTRRYLPEVSADALTAAVFSDQYMESNVDCSCGVGTYDDAYILQCYRNSGTSYSMGMFACGSITHSSATIGGIRLEKGFELIIDRNQGTVERIVGPAFHSTITINAPYTLTLKKYVAPIPDSPTVKKAEKTLPEGEYDPSDLNDQGIKTK